MHMDPEPQPPPTTLIVRLRRDATGRLRGFVERPRTGAKEAFDDLPDIAQAIKRLLSPEERGATGGQAGEVEGHHNHVRLAGDREAPQAPAATEGHTDVTS